MNGYSKLMLKASALLILVFALSGIFYTYVLNKYSQDYFKERTQLLNQELAQYTVDHVSTFDSLGNVNEAILDEIMHSMMIINPSVEVYLLNVNGEILKHVAPHKKVVLEKVDMEPIHRFLANENENEKIVIGEDPRNPEEGNIFSAAPVYHNEELAAYYYIILSSELERSLSTVLKDSFAIKKGSLITFLSVFLGVLIALIGLFFITKNLNQISKGMRRFKSGDFGTRIPGNKSSDFYDLKEGFNKMAAKIEENIEELKGVDKLRRDLVANVSHDLRTPLSVASGYIESLQHNPENLTESEKKDFLKRAYDSLRRLGSLIDQLFEYSKLQSGVIKPKKEPFLLQDLVGDLVQRLNLKAESKNAKISFEIQENIPLINADIGMVERAIQNLLDNAINYIDNGGEIEISLKKAGDEVMLQVRDNGPGIAEDERDFIFDRYVRGTSSTSGSEGSGLGLAIVKRIMEIHNSKVELISSNSKGTCMALCLNKALVL